MKEGERQGEGRKPEVSAGPLIARASSHLTKSPEAELQHWKREEFGAPQWQGRCPSTAANQRRETVKFKPPPSSSAGTCPESVCRKCGRSPRPRRGGGEKGVLSLPSPPITAGGPGERRAAAPIRAAAGARWSSWLQLQLFSKAAFPGRS